jgi:hypothetical protein
LRTGILVGSFPELSDAIEQSAYFEAARLWVDPISKEVKDGETKIGEVSDIYVVGNTDKKQKLDAGISVGTFGETLYGFDRLEWFGQLDGDNQTDYIICFLSPHGDMVTRLYLSSTAKEGELVSPVSELIYFDVP